MHNNNDNNEHSCICKSEKTQKQEQIIEIIIKKVKRGKELSIIASEIEEEEQDVKPLYDAVVAEAPDYNMDKIKSRLK